MKKVSLDVWIQLIGMLSIVASLIFVGMEMRQSQRIALAAQQTARVQILTEIVTGDSHGLVLTKIMQPAIEQTRYYGYSRMTTYSTGWG